MGSCGCSAFGTIGCGFNPRPLVSQALFLMMTESQYEFAHLNDVTERVRINRRAVNIIVYKFNIEGGGCLCRLLNLAR